MKTFYNWTSEDYTAKWNGNAFLVKSGEVVHNAITNESGSTVVLDPGVLYSFGKALAKREMQKERISLESLEIVEQYTARSLATPVLEKVAEKEIVAPKAKVAKKTKVVKEVAEDII